MAPLPMGLSGPMAQDHLMTEIQGEDLIRSQAPEDEQSRSAVLLRFRCEQYHKGLQSGSIIFGKNAMSAHNKLLRIHCKAGSVSVRLFFLKHKPNVKTIARYTDGISYAINSPFCCTNTARRSTSLEDQEIGKQFAFLWRVLADQLSSLMEMTKVHSSSQRSSSALKIEGTAFEHLCSNLPDGTWTVFYLLHLTSMFLVFPPEVLQRVLSQASTANV